MFWCSVHNNIEVNRIEKQMINWKREFKCDAHFNTVMTQPQINVLSMSGFVAG